MEFKLPTIPTDKEQLNNILPKVNTSIDRWKDRKNGIYLWFELERHDTEFINANIDFFQRYKDAIDKNLKKCNN